MSGTNEKTARQHRDDIYRLTRIDTERAVDKLLTIVRNRSDDAVDRYMRVGEMQPDPCDEAVLTAADVDRIAEIRLSHSMAFAHALLQGAADVFEDHRTGLALLKGLIEVELTELEQEARFVRQATTAGSNAIN